MMAAEALEHSSYDPFARGPFPVGVRTTEMPDPARARVFPCEIWYPAAAGYAGRDLAPEAQDVFTAPLRPPQSQAAVRDAAPAPGPWPLVVYSHPSLYHRRAASFLCTHLASHGYVVAALDHSEVIAPELARRADETPEQKAARMDAVISSRVPDVRLLLDRLLQDPSPDSDIALDPARVGVVGHSFGGWTALALPDVEPRVRAVVALAPGGTPRPRPGILPLHLAFDWGRDIPTLFLAAENDAALPLPGMYELFERTPATRHLVVLHRADHVHFMDNIEREHEAFRTASVSPELAAIQRDMLPIAELTSGEEAHLFTRGLTVCHFDAFLRTRPEAQRFLNSDLEAELAFRGIDAMVNLYR